MDTQAKARATDEELRKWARWHRQDEEAPELCHSNEPWPCPTAKMLEALDEAEGKLEAVEREIHTVTDYGTKTCEHAVCGLARRIGRILRGTKEGE